MEDVDNSIYNLLEDLQIPLTDKGLIQARNFGAFLAQLLQGNQNVHFYTSPGVRNVQTLKSVLPQLPDNINIQTNIEPLLVKQNWGKISGQDRGEIEADRYRIGVLRYDFPQGETIASLIDRLSRFIIKITALQRRKEEDLVVFSHGFEFRIILMLILGWNEEKFESFSNLNNCEYRILTQQEDKSYTLNTPLRRHGQPVTRIMNAKKR